MDLRRATAPLAALLLLSAPAAHAQSPAKPFDAATAWSSFETLLRERYG